ncbi:hypothetical protein K440DRAFT_643304 [Wilcoxina mikolae CBS 423.85]|nr:hypothetical protein K440DRAFT_643304 [Wilcoxina mikolae CBS 423.85]
MVKLTAERGLTAGRDSQIVQMDTATKMLQIEKKRNHELTAGVNVLLKANISLRKDLAAVASERDALVTNAACPHDTKNRVRIKDSPELKTISDGSMVISEAMARWL